MVQMKKGQAADAELDRAAEEYARRKGVEGAGGAAGGLGQGTAAAGAKSWRS